MTAKARVARALIVLLVRSSILITLKALSYFDDGNLRRLSDQLKARLAKAAREMDLDKLRT